VKEENKISRNDRTEDKEDKLSDEDEDLVT